MRAIAGVFQAKVAIDLQQCLLVSDVALPGFGENFRAKQADAGASHGFIATERADAGIGIVIEMRIIEKREGRKVIGDPFESLGFSEQRDRCLRAL